MRPLDPAKHEKIIQAVFFIVGRYGLENVNINQLSKTAGIGVGSLYTYFKSKEEVIAAAYSSVEHMLTQSMFEGFDINKPIKDSLRKIFINSLNYRFKHPDQTLFIDQYVQSKYLQLNLSDKIKEYEEDNKPLYALLKKGRDEGLLKKLNDITMIIAIDGCIRSTYNGVTQKLLPLRKSTIEDSFNIIWNGISK